MIGAVAISLLSYLMWAIHPAWETILKFWTLLIPVLLFRTALTIFVAPYNALGAERSSIQGHRALFNIMGMILAIAGLRKRCST